MIIFNKKSALPSKYNLQGMLSFVKFIPVLSGLLTFSIIFFQACQKESNQTLPKNNIISENEQDTISHSSFKCHIGGP